METKILLKFFKYECKNVILKQFCISKNKSLFYPSKSIKSMKKLFLTIAVVIAFVAVSNAQSGKGICEFKKTEFDFGKVSLGKTIFYSFIFKNTGEDPVQILDVKASAKMIVPSFSGEPIMPNQEGSILVKFNGGVGRYSKFIEVTSNAKNSLVRLHIKGEVVATLD